MDPSENNPGTPGEGQPAAPAAPAANEPAAPAAATPSTNEPDYKSLYETEKQRRAGLDKKLSQLRKGSQQGGIDPNLPEDQRKDAELEQLRLEKAENQLKDEAKEIVERYPELPKGVKNAILKNPRGFLNSTTQTIEDAVLDLEEYVANVVEEIENGETPTLTPAQTDPKKISVATQNATVSSTGKVDISTLNTVEKQEQAIAQGLVTQQEIEDYVRNLGKERHSK